jgi:hypothetical protein
LSQVFTLPVSVIATRQQTLPPDERKSFISTATGIIAEDGVISLWTGFRASLVLSINPAITYGVFERLKSMHVKNRTRKSLRPHEAFVLGALSKTLATIVTCTTMNT